VDAEGGPGGVCRTAAEADEDAGSAGPHEVQRGGVRRGAADDDRDVELVDEALEVERLRTPAHVLGADRGAPDHEEVHAGVDDRPPELLGALRGQGAGDRDATVADLLDPGGDEVGLDLLGVDLLHPPGGLVDRERGDLGQQRLGVLVAGPEPLEVEDAEAAEPAQRHSRRRRHDRIHGRGGHRQLEAVGVDLPRDADLLRVACAPARHDGDVVEGVRPAAALAPADLDLVHRTRLVGGVPADRRRAVGQSRAV
jgi:hypothetical protein